MVLHLLEWGFDLLTLKLLSLNQTQFAFTYFCTIFLLVILWFQYLGYRDRKHYAFLNTVYNLSIRLSLYFI